MENQEAKLNKEIKEEKKGRRGNEDKEVGWRQQASGRLSPG